MTALKGAIANIENGTMGAGKHPWFRAPDREWAKKSKRFHEEGARFTFRQRSNSLLDSRFSVWEKALTPAPEAAL